ncbi:alpha/beta fold hydrolase, partial [Kibdelosporangium lantanae]
MDTTTSADGTTIALDVTGQGPTVVLVGGAFNDRTTVAGLAGELSADFTAVAYDRRGRGDSGDTKP